MFIRVRTASGENNIAVAQIRNFEPTGENNSRIVLLDGTTVIANESNRVLRKLIAESGVTTEASTAE